MALMPAIMSLFGSRQAAAPAPGPANPGTAAEQIQQTAAANQNQAVPNQTTPLSNGSVAAIPAVSATGDASPLANFADLWKTDPNTNQTTKSLVPAFNLDHKGLMEAAQKINFTAHIPQETVTKALSGDQAAFLDVLNQAAQFGFANAVAGSGKIIEGSLATAQTALQDRVLPEAIRASAVNQALDAANPIFSDPAVSPMLGALKQQFQTKYPTASPAEIATLATQYLQGMSQKIVTASGGTITNPTTGAQNGFQSPKEPDWENFFGA